MKRRNLFYYKLLCLSSTTIMDFEDEINQMLEDPYETNYPIDINNNYDTLFEDEVYITDEVLANPYLIAYFTEQPLSFFRISEDISNISLKYCCLSEYETELEFKENVIHDVMQNASKNGKFIYTFRSKIETLFILSLIKKIDEFKNKTKEIDVVDPLETSKYRLMYLLDDLSLNLLENNNLDNIYNQLLKEYNENGFEDNEFESESYEIINQFGMLAKVFVYDLFEGLYDETLNIKKLAFIKTYYEMTQDKDIISIFNKYCDSKLFWDYNNYIRSNNIILKKNID